MSTPWSGHELAASPFSGEFDAESPFAAVGTTGESPVYPAYPAYQEFEGDYGFTSTTDLGAEAVSLPLAHESPEQSTVRQAIAGGNSDLNKLTNLVFFARHPERNGRGLSPSEPGIAALGAEWTTIRDTIVRPLMAASPSPGTTTGLWVPGAERLANPKSAGGTYLDAPWRFVFHTIEGEPSAQGFRTLAAGHANPPHLWAMPSADLLLQTIPLDRSAYALARPGSIQTNRLRTIQVECWGFAAKMVNATPEMRAWLADRVLAPVARLVPINLNQVSPIGPGEPCYGKNSSCRMRLDEWQTFNGVCGHKNVPDNDHWDPGQLDLGAIAARAKASIGATSYIQRERPLADHDGPGFAAERDDEGSWQLEGQNGHHQMAWMAPSGNGEGGLGFKTWAEFDQLAPPPVPPSTESELVRSALQSGVTGENGLTDLVFFRRYPARNGRPISRDEPNYQALSQEWLSIRDTLVRPILRGPQPAPAGPRPASVGIFDGVPCANWLIPYLSWAREHGWQGQLLSGWRDPAYSEGLCLKMCGAPSCPGRCAGRSSNHSGDVKPKGAIDVSDPIRFGQLMTQCPLSPRIFNDLPNDLNHFSASGH
ncbi:MAG: hypothetical protein ACRDTH_29515 [Pseudonocardiaceae bacterium]